MGEEKRVRATPHVNMWDLNVGRDVLIYGKTFRFTGCDPFTRHFLSCEGVIVPPEEPVPENVYARHRAAVGKRDTWWIPYARIHSSYFFKQFFMRRNKICTSF